jgi:Polyphosphate kinase 2 (PPK2)
MIRHTATEAAPWYVVPADNKWFTRRRKPRGVGGLARERAPLPMMGWLDR